MLRSRTDNNTSALMWTAHPYAWLYARINFQHVIRCLRSSSHSVHFIIFSHVHQIPYWKSLWNLTNQQQACGNHPQNLVQWVFVVCSWVWRRTPTISQGTETNRRHVINTSPLTTSDICCIAWTNNGYYSSSHLIQMPRLGSNECPD